MAKRYSQIPNNKSYEFEKDPLSKVRPEKTDEDEKELGLLYYCAGGINAQCRNNNYGSSPIKLIKIQYLCK